MSKFSPGHSKLGGRQKGSLNRQTRYLIEELNNNNVNPIKLLLEEVYPLLDSNKQADVLLNLLQYIYPKRKAIDIQYQSEDPPMVINQNLTLEQMVEQAGKIYSRLKSHLDNKKRYD